ncbi:MAG: biotin--[acetyl-CoA-carboxylase] ligase [Acidimicrobiales bacterium]
MEGTYPDDKVPESRPDEPVSGTRFRVRWVAETTSTNSDLAQAAAGGEPEGLVIATDHQTAGRGRLGRTWTAPPGSALLASFLLRPTLGSVHLAVTAVSLAAVAACVRVAGVEPVLKWPNDLVVSTAGRWYKLAGVLAEATTDRHQVTGVVVGLGLNVVRAADLPAELVETATSLDVLGAGAVDRRTLLVAICEELEARYLTLLEHPAALMDEYRRRCVTIGQDVRIVQPARTWEGRAVGVTATGALQVSTGAVTRTVEAGDVVHLRPT